MRFYTITANSDRIAVHRSAQEAGSVSGAGLFVRGWPRKAGHGMADLAVDPDLERLAGRCTGNQIHQPEARHYKDLGHD
jgi:hypothetical protein